jgi:hypothetical protein
VIKSGRVRVLSLARGYSVDIRNYSTIFYHITN